MCRREVSSDETEGVQAYRIEERTAGKKGEMDAAR